MKFKLNDKVQPKKTEAWIEQYGDFEPPVHTVVSFEGKDYVCEAKGYNYHLFSEDNLEAVYETEEEHPSSVMWVRSTE